MVVFIHTHKPSVSITSKALSVYVSMSLLIISVLIKYTTPAFLAYIIIPEYPQEIKISVLEQQLFYHMYILYCQVLLDLSISQHLLLQQFTGS